MYGSEYWAFNKRDEIKTEVTKMTTLRWMCGMIGLDEIRNEYRDKKEFGSIGCCSRRNGEE